MTVGEGLRRTDHQHAGLAGQAHQDRGAALGPGAGELDRGRFSGCRERRQPVVSRYETAWHASPLIGTIAFVAYAVAVIVGLLWLKGLPALLGRRAVLFGAIAGQVLALVLFAVAGSFVLIVVGRVLQGLASGAALGTLSAAMVESDAECGTVASAASPGAGSGSGALQTIYLILAAILAIQALFVLDLMPRG